MYGVIINQKLNLLLLPNLDPRSYIGSETIRACFSGAVLLFLNGNFCIMLSFQVHHDMTAPLSHYYIFTGHNSYLTGNQLTSDCSDVPIIKALKRGVRVIELDIWPNSAKDDVLVLHGRLTNSVFIMLCLTCYCLFSSHL